ncbi:MULTISPECIES: hypothetical protein [unclassified Streptomyces]|uniref:hypothetical protein n=1 Tax=unclassified Streptomyces TaxID=2593676 RepID=UPI00381F63D0
MAGISHSGDDDLVITGPLDISDHSGSTSGSDWRYADTDNDSDSSGSGHDNNGVIGNNVTITGTVAMGHHNNVRGR